MVINLDLSKYNRHWQGYLYPFPQKRDAFRDCLKALKGRFIGELVGLRRTGKTTIIFQLINHLIQTGVNPASIWYFSFDEVQPSLEPLIAKFSQQTYVRSRSISLGFI